MYACPGHRDKCDNLRVRTRHSVRAGPKILRHSCGVGSYLYWTHFSLRRMEPLPQRRIRIRVSRRVGTVDARYLSVALDIGQIAEPTRFWNPDGSGENASRGSFNFSRPRLANLATALAPAYLRIGGTEADRCFYALSHHDKAATPPPPPPHTSVLTAVHIDAIGAFAQLCGFDVCFCVNAGRGARPYASSWDGTQTRALMLHVAARDLPFRVFEFGNEPNAWPLFHENLIVQPEAYARDLAEFMRCRDLCAPAARVAAPGTAFWPTLGEVPALGWPKGSWRPILIRRFLRRALTCAVSELGATPDIISWHYYPGLSSRSALARYRPAAALATAVAVTVATAIMVAAASASDGSAMATRGSPRQIGASVALAACAAVVVVGAFWCHAVRTLSDGSALRRVEVLDTVRTWAEKVHEVVRSIPFPNALPDRSKSLHPGGRLGGGPVIWLGETGSAQVGGQPEVSGRWAAALWWLDQLGALARCSHEVQVRQTLCGADYGLLDEGTLEPTPEYWASVLWKRLMGEHVYDVSADPPPPPTLRLYCHAANGGSGNVGATARRRQRSPPRRESDAPTLVTVLAINLDAAPIALDLALTEDPVNPPEIWTLDAPSLASRNVTINGTEPRTAVDGSVPALPGQCAARCPVVPPGAAIFVRMSAMQSNYSIHSA